jgi:hypothetical protein
MAADDDHRHLQREDDQAPEALAPRVDHAEALSRKGWVVRGVEQLLARHQAEQQHEDGADQHEAESVGQPTLGDRSEPQRHPRERRLPVERSLHSSPAICP